MFYHNIHYEVYVKHYVVLHMHDYNLQIYELADVAAILGLQKSRVKNWTIGRPFSVRPSVRASFGKGSRNLFSRNDVFSFALVKALNERGAPVDAIQKMLERFAGDLPNDALWKGRTWLVLKRANRDVSCDLFEPEDMGYINLRIEAEDEIVCSYMVNLASIVDAVSEKINALNRQQRKSAGVGDKRT